MIFTKNYNYSPAFKISWGVVSLLFIIQILIFKIPHGFFTRPFNNIILMSCSYFLIKSYKSPLPKLCSRGNQTKTIYLGLIFLIVLCISKSALGSLIYEVIPVIALGFLIVFRNFINKRQIILSAIITILSALSALTGLWGPILPEKWAMLQFILVFPGFLAGWALLNGSGYGYLGVGRSIFVTEGTAKAVKSFAYGMYLALPWALGKVLMGNTPSFTWVKSWWNILASFNIAVGGEGWGRALWVPIFFFILSRFSDTGNIFRASTLIVAYWATFLSLDVSIFNVLVQTPVAVILFAMPIATIMFNKDLETALGFHFSIQFFKLLVAFLINNGVL